MVHSSVCAYPWDLLNDETAVARFAALGADRVMLAAAYHGVRAATPQHASHRLFDAPTSALYIPVRDAAWRGRRLRPASAYTWMGKEDSFDTARAALAKADLAVGAWAVLTHDDAPAPEQTADLRVRNAFGDTFAYALCPASTEVLDYCTTLVTEIAATGVEDLMVEAVGQLGIEHFGLHEKTSGADWSPIDSALLSICFCRACTAALGAIGVDPRGAAIAVREAVGSRAASVEEAIGEYAEPILRSRRAATTTLLNEVVRAARDAGATRISAHAGLDVWSTSSFASLERGAEVLDAVVLSERTLETLSTETISELRARHAPAVAAYVSALAPVVPGELSRRWKGYADLGVDELVVYHGGLLSESRAASVAAAIASVRLRTKEEK